MRAVQMLTGFVANDPEEAMYINVSLDGKGKPLTGANRYVIHFAKGQQPKVNAFWSIPCTTLNTILWIIRLTATHSATAAE